MRRIERLGRGMAVFATALALLAPRPAEGFRVTGGTDDHWTLARWAVERFDDAGLDLPRMEIAFFDDRSGCEGRLGYYDDGVASLCRKNLDTLGARNLVHEMAHGWAEANLDDADRDRFLRLRGLSTWNDPDAVWDDRGFEHAAEIVAWAISDQGDGILAPSLPNNTPSELAAAYEVLTGSPMPELDPSVLWNGA
jgi:hypothetical protein